MDILIADSRPEVRSALRVLLNEEADVNTIAEAHDVPSLLATAESVQPAVVLVDWDLAASRPSNARRGLLSEIVLAAPGARVIALSTRHEAEAEALEAGADAFVSKCGTPDQLLVAVRTLDREE